MATASGVIDSDQENFCRMSILMVDYALKVLQNVLQKELETKYPNLYNPNTGLLNGVLGDRTVRDILFGLSPRVFNTQQRNQLYPNGKTGNPSKVPIGDLDITLTVLLLRNITTLNPRPGLNAWDNPFEADKSREATIGRVKQYRNIVYAHANKAAISDHDFRVCFSGLKSNLLDLSSSFTNEEYDAILYKYIDVKLFKKYQDIMEEWQNYDKDVKDAMEAGFQRIADKVTQVTEKVTQVLDGMSEIKKLPFEKGHFDQTSKAVTENQGRRADRCPENEYKNESEPRGRALIINNKTFFVDHLPTRYGTEVDVDALRKLFICLHYDTYVIRNLAANEMKEKIEQESQREEHKIYDSFILFLLSYGTEGAVYGTDGYPLAYKDIQAILNNKNCPNLRGKPKMIFIQACQGKMRDSGAFPEGHTAQQPQQAPPATNLDGEQTDASHEIPQPSNEPTISDFLGFHATSPEYVSWRHTEKGTWFVQTIVDIFSRHAHNLDVVEMLTKVNNAISQKQTLRGHKQAAVLDCSLLKKVYFNITRGEQE